MLLLGTSVFPTSRDQLIATLTDGLARVFVLPTGRPVVELSGNYPALEHLRIDVTGAAIRPDFRPAPSTGPRQPGIVLARLEVAGMPVRYEGAAATFELIGHNVRFEFTRDTQGRGLLEPVDAHAGHVRAFVGQADLQALTRAVLKTGAAEHGVKIEDAQIKLTGAGGRSVAGELRVIGSKRVFLTNVRAVLHVRGNLTIDEAFNATVSGLTCEGEGMVGAMVVGLLRDELRKWDGRQIPLTAFSLGRLRLHDLRLDTADGLRVEAEFGS